MCLTLFCVVYFLLDVCKWALTVCSLLACGLAAASLYVLWLNGRKRGHEVSGGREGGASPHVFGAANSNGTNWSHVEAIITCSF